VRSTVAVLALWAAGLAFAQQASAPARTDNLVALEMGGRVETRLRELTRENSIDKAMDGDPKTVWLSWGTKPEVVFSFFAHDTALVSSVTITLPPAGPDPIWKEPGDAFWPKDVEISISMDGPTTGFRKVAVQTLPKTAGDHAIAISPAVQARYVKLAVGGNYGSIRAVLIGDIAVREGQAPGYTPLLKRHPDLGSLLATGVLPKSDGAPAAQLPAAPAAGDVCAAPVASGAAPRRPESRGVLVIASDSAENYGPYFYSIYLPDSPTVRYFSAAPGDGRVDSSIFRRVDYRPIHPEAARVAALVPGSGIDTAVLAQACDAKTSLPDAFTRALVDWVADGHKLIIQDSDKCGPRAVPDYGFLPYPFATNNPGPQGASSLLSIVENNFIASALPDDPGFFDEENWRLKKNGNVNNDFGDSNTIVQFDPHWCGMLVGTNVTGGHGFVAAYAHHGRGLILYDGLDWDQNGNVAYRNYVARQLLLPFDPDGLPCSTRLSPFVVTTEPSLVQRAVVGGQTISYPLSVLAVQPGYKGTVKLSLALSPAVPGLTSKIEPDTVTLGNDAKAALTVTLPQKLPDGWRMAVRGGAADATGTLCLSAHERRTGRLTVSSALGGPARPSRKNLLIVLDLSGSMNLALGASTRIATARQVLRTTLARVPDDFNVGLRLYGHRFGSKQQETCTDTELVVPIRPLDRPQIARSIATLRPRGETPLVYSVLQAGKDLQSAGGGSIVVITDGEESCGGDFTAATAALKAAGVDLQLNIVGFTLTDAKANQPLAAMAGATGGSFYTATDGAALTRALVAATLTRFPYTAYAASGATAGKGEAGDAGLELPAGDYKIVVRAGDQDLVVEKVSIAPGRDAAVTIVRKGDGFALNGVRR
jgi:Mg-chelatase subunit ChlD